MPVMKENFLTNAHDTTFSPTGLYNFVKGSEMTDSSGNGKDLIQTDAAMEAGDYMAGVAEGLLHGIYYRNNAADFQYSGAMTLAGLCFMSTYSPDQYVQMALANNTGTTDALYALQITTDGIFRYAHQTNQVTHTIESDQINYSLYQWHHFCFTRDSNGTGIKLFVDGNLVKSGTTGAAPGNQGTAYFSTGGVANHSPGAQDDGTVSSIVIYNQELSPNQVKYLARKTLGFNRVA